MPRKRKPQPSFHFNFRVVINHDEQSAQIHLVQYRGTRIIGFDPEPYTPIGTDWKMGTYQVGRSIRYAPLNSKKKSVANAIKELKSEMTNMRRAFKAPPLDYKKLVKINESRGIDIPVLSATAADMEAIRTKYPLPF